MYFVKAKLLMYHTTCSFSAYFHSLLHFTFVLHIFGLSLL